MALAHSVFAKKNVQSHIFFKQEVAIYIEGAIGRDLNSYRNVLHPDSLEKRLARELDYVWIPWSKV